MTPTLGLCVTVLLVCAALLFLRRGILWLLKLALRSGVGLALLSVLSPLCSSIGVHLGVNWFNALILGLLGAPGFGLLLLLQWLLR